VTYCHINRRRYGMKSIVGAHCPDCKRWSRIIGFHQEWYGWDETCLRCGRGWQDGEWLPLEFERGVRARHIRQAKATWRNTEAKVIRRVVV
jgi:hypothetical protein